MSRRKFASADDPQRILRNILVDTDGCWLWTQSVNTYGYGQASIWAKTGTRRTQAHRLSYELFVGPIPDGLVIDHLCRNRRCVNPDHLEPVTNRENLLRGETHAARNVAKTHCPQGHEYTTGNLRAGREGRSCRQCHMAYMADYNRRPEVRAAKRARRAAQRAAGIQAA